MKLNLFFKNAVIMSIYLAIILAIFIPIVFSENTTNMSINKNFTANYQKDPNISNNSSNITQIDNQILGEESNKGFFSWIAGLSNIGTFIAALIALFTLLELKKQRQLANTPKIFITSCKDTFNISWTKVEQLDHTLPFEWEGETIEKYIPDSELPLYNIPLEIVNAGLSPALNAKITWKFKNIPELFNSFNELGLKISCAIDNDDMMSTYKILVGRVLHGFPSHAITPIKDIDYILPYSNVKNEKNIFLPPFFSLLVSLSLSSFSLSKNVNNTIIPHLTGFIEYSDLSETIHKSEFEVELIPIMHKKIKEIEYEEGYLSAIISINIKMKKKKKPHIIFLNKMINQISNI